MWGNVGLQEIMPFKACVVSTGGGAVERRKNWGYMQHGIVVWLDGPAEILARRACKDGQGSRPMLGDSKEVRLSSPFTLHLPILQYLPMSTLWTSV